MKIPLIQGTFSNQDAIDLITQMINIKIKFQESKINSTSSEEEIKMREKRIKQLQKDLYDARKEIELRGTRIEMFADIQI